MAARRVLIAARWLVGLGLLIMVHQAAQAASMTVYVDPAGDCAGMSPCYPWMSQALSNVSDGGTIIVTSDTDDNILGPGSAQNITIKGDNPGITMTGGVNVTSPVVGWTIQDLVFGGGFLIQDVVGSLTVRNVTTTGMTLGYLTQDTTADITIMDNVLPGNDGAVISILGAPGYDINGSILVQDNVGVDAVNIFTYVAAGVQSDLNADITLVGNDLRKGCNIGVASLGASGTGNVTGTVVLANNTMGDKLGLTIDGAATGDITGTISFSGNTGLWLAVLTIDSTLGGDITGSVDVIGNDVEFVEISSKNDLSATVTVDGNRVVDRTGGVAQGPTVQVEGGAVQGAVTVEGTTGGVAYVGVRSRLGGVTSLVRILGNAVGWIEIDSAGGSIVWPFEIADNQLPSDPLPGSPLGAYSFVSVHTGPSGDLVGGSISGTSMDRLQFDLGGTLTGPLMISRNIFRDYASLILGASATSPGVTTFTGNLALATTYFDGFTTLARFNNLAGMMTVVPGTNVDAVNNWWGCNQGAGSSSCAPRPTSPTPYAPWLTLGAAFMCTGPTSAVVGFDVRQNSDGLTPSGNVTPGEVAISTTVGAVSQTPVSLADGQGSTSLTFPPASSPVVHVQLGAALVTLQPTCVWSRDSVGVIRPANSVLYLRNSNTSGYAHVSFVFGVLGDRFFSGDWNNDGMDTVGSFRSGVFYLRNSNTTGYADIAFAYGRPGDLPVAGDWDGDGIDTIGAFRNGVFYLRNANTTGYADLTFAYGLPGDVPLSGDWNGDGIDTVGIFRNGVFYLRNSNTTGYADITFGYGLPGDAAIAGDWNDDGLDTVGASRGGVFFLRNSNATGYADVTFAYGLAGDQPFAGDWDGAP